MKPTPKNWSRISSSLYYQDAARAIDWLCSAFGFEVRLKIEGEGGKIAHSELVFGEGIVMVGDEGAGHAKGATYQRSPRSIGGANTQNMMVYVDDAVAHCERARKAGAKILDEPTVHDYGEGYWADRSYGCEDLEGHRWWFSERLRDPS
jgi:uncharacterized glyoxalase superfamily protein PhnB